jgi:hypothetical protein
MTRDRFATPFVLSDAERTAPGRETVVSVASASYSGKDKLKPKGLWSYDLTSAKQAARSNGRLATFIEPDSCPCQAR